MRGHRPHTLIEIFPFMSSIIIIIILIIIIIITITIIIVVVIIIILGHEYLSLPT